MKLAGRTSLSNSHGRDMLGVEDRSGGKLTGHRIDPALEVVEPIWSDEVVRGLSEDWLVPVIVDRIMADLLNSTWVT
jgi:hypothetical protein